ncbi:hypothetical protein EYF80_059992 [Liparis tanakae]|uniref:Uncharacterized protein n=1 Tax=Liparis tanakae TaxID=230148 RepID=A0A4Z2ELL9_9TELE|nr:hypothetical protein EYF80_059992 [Liparis tanakae]
MKGDTERMKRRLNGVIRPTGHIVASVPNEQLPQRAAGTTAARHVFGPPATSLATSSMVSSRQPLAEFNKLTSETAFHLIFPACLSPSLRRALDSTPPPGPNPLIGMPRGAPRGPAVDEGPRG